MARTLRTIVSVLVMIATIALTSIGPASAGGSSWNLDREHYQVGETLFAWAQVAWAHNPSLGTPEEGPYHASVVALDGAATPVGDLTVSLEPYTVGTVRFGPHHATLRFTIPNVPPGEYVIVHANDAGKYLGDLSGRNTFWIDAPVLEAAPRLTG